MGVHGRTFNTFISGRAAKKSLKAHKKPMSSNGQNGGGLGGKSSPQQQGQQQLPQQQQMSQVTVIASSSSGNSHHQSASTTPLSPPTLAVTTTTDTAPSSSGSNTNTGATIVATEAAAAAAAAVAASTTTTNMAVDSSPRESGDDSEDESEILEESPCGRWLKRREEVDQRDVPGIDCVHLAMDTEEGVEVVWNEVQYASLQELKSQEDKMRQVFDNLLQLDHQNIVKFHRYWTDTQNAERPRVIFITEYMSSGSLKQFLKRTKRNAKRLPLEAWRRWCTQILSALSYLHSCTPPVIHGNLTCDSIFIQHNGLVKIGSVVPDAVHYNVRQQQQHNSKADERGAQHFMAPEYGSAEQLTAAVDIYAFGMCALEMAALEIQPASGTSGSDHSSDSINEETILRTINSLEHDLQRDLIFKCLRRNPNERPSANDLLFHPLLFEVHSLKLLAAHCLVHAPKNRTMFSETVIDGMMQQYNRPEVIMAKVIKSDDEHDYRLCDVQAADKLEKFVEDVKFGVYPLTAYTGKKAPPHFKSRAASPENVDSVKSATPETVDIESRRIVNMMCRVKKLKEDSTDISMIILLRMDDKMNRQLTCQVTENDSAVDLTNELVHLGFVHIDDQDKIQALLVETLRASFAAFSESGGQPLTFSATINEPTTIGGGSVSGGGGGGIVVVGNTGASNTFAVNSNTGTFVGLGNGSGGIGMITGTGGADFGTSGVFLKDTMATATTIAGQFERNWSVADADPTIMFNQMTQHQQQQPQTSTFLFVSTPEMQQHLQLHSPMQQQQQQHHQQQPQLTIAVEANNHPNLVCDTSIADAIQHEQLQQQHQHLQQQQQQQQQQQLHQQTQQPTQMHQLQNNPSSTIAAPVTNTIPTTTTATTIN